MEKQNDRPDFKQLNDRFILNPTATPSIGAKTNLDSKTNTDHNPYTSERDKLTEGEKVDDFFTS